MSDKLVQVAAQNIVANVPTYTPKQANLIAQNGIIAETNLTGVTTSVEKTKLVVVLSNMGEESIPNPSLFKRNSDAYLATDTISSQYSLVKLSQISLLDQLNTLNNYRRVFQELKVTDDSYRLFNINKQLVSGVSNSQIVLKSLAKSLSSTIGKTDITSIAFNKAVLDLVYSGDLTSLSTSKVLLSSVDVPDQVTVTANFNRSFSDLIDATDDFLGEANVDDDQVALVNKVLINWVSSSEIKAVLLESNKVDTVVGVEQVSLSTSTTRTESANIQQEIRILADKGNNDTVNFTESAISSVNKIVLDIGKISDPLVSDVYKQVLSHSTIEESLSAQTTKNLFNQFSVSDITTSVWLAFGQYEDKSTLLDLAFFDVIKSIQSLASTKEDFSYLLNTSFSDSFSSLDTVHTETIFKRSFNSFVDATDDFLGEANVDDDQVALVGKGLLDNISSNEQANLFTLKTLANSLESVDSLSLFPSKLLANTVSSTDTFNFFIFTNRFFNETATTNSSGFINNQSYFAESYAEPGYVGTNINFS